MDACRKCGRADETVVLVVRGRSRCPRCWASRQRAERRVATFGIPALVLVVAGPWAVVGYVPGVVVAEGVVVLLQAVVARALGWRIVFASLGSGRRLAAIGRVSVRRHHPRYAMSYVPPGAVSRERQRAAPGVPAAAIAVVAFVVAGLPVSPVVRGALMAAVMVSVAGIAAGREATGLSEHHVAMMRVTLAMPLAEAAAMYPDEPTVTDAYATVLLDAGDPGGAVRTIGDSGRNQQADPRERALAAATKAVALAALGGSGDRDEAWAAATFALRVAPGAHTVAAFARVLLASGCRDDARAVAREAAAMAYDDRSYRRAATVAALARE